MTYSHALKDRVSLRRLYEKGNNKMRTDYENIDYIRGCIKTCQKKGHIQQVAFSTYHDALTQICFTCEAVRTSINHAEILGSKKGVPLQK